MSVQDLLATLAGIAKPPGDPGAVRAAAARLHSIASALDSTGGGMNGVIDQARSAWSGTAAEAFADHGLLIVYRIKQGAGTLREAAEALTAYAGRLEAAQASWQAARDGAIAGRFSLADAPVVGDLIEAIDEDTAAALRRAVDQAERAADDARAAAAELAERLRALAERAAPLPPGVQAPTWEGEVGGWLRRWLDRAWDDPVGAASEWIRETYAGLGDTLQGYKDLLVMGLKAVPVYALADFEDYKHNLHAIGDIGKGLFMLTPIYGRIDPAGHAEARKAFLASLVGWEQLRDGNIPRWAGQFLPDLLLSAATAGGGSALKGTRGAAALRGLHTASKAEDLPSWFKRLREGKRWHQEVQEHSLKQGGRIAKELYVEKAGGGYRVVDLYNFEDGEIISLKHTQLAKIRTETAKSYIDQLARDYPAGARILDVPSTPEWARGERLRGRLVLLIPEQHQPVPQEVLDYARKKEVIIRDINGKELT